MGRNYCSRERLLRSTREKECLQRGDPSKRKKQEENIEEELRDVRERLWPGCSSGRQVWGRTGTVGRRRGRGIHYAAFKKKYTDGKSDPICQRSEGKQTSRLSGLWGCRKTIGAKKMKLVTRE